MNDTIWTAIISGVVILFGAFITTRATIANYKQGGSQRDLAAAAQSYADASAQYAELNEKLQGRLAAADEKIKRLDMALTSARAFSEKSQAEITDVKTKLVDAEKLIEKQNKKIEFLMVWVEAARNLMVDNGIKPPVLEVL